MLGQIELEEIAEHFSRVHGIRGLNMTAIINQVVRDAFPDATGLAVRDSDVVVMTDTCRVGCAGLCYHTKDTQEEVFGEDEMDALILAHVRGAEEVRR